MISTQSSLPLSELHTHLTAIAGEISARLVVAVDAAGNVIESVGPDNDRNIPTLAALAAANLAATHEISRLASIEANAQAPQTLLIEGRHGAVILVEGVQDLNFIAVLSPESLIGLARLEMRRLATLTWTDEGSVPQSLAEEFLGKLDIDF